MFMACSIIRCIIFFFSSRRRHTRCALVTGVQTCALPILMTLDAFCEVVDRYFEGPDWEAKPVPSQSIPATLERVLAALDALKPTGWLAMDNALRDLDGDARDRISYLISDLEPTLREKTQRRFMKDTEEPLQVWLCRNGNTPDPMAFGSEEHT